MGLVGLEHREFGVVGRVGPLIAEVPADLENPFQAAHHEPLQIEFRRDPQIQIEVVGVDMGTEGAGIRATVHRLQDRSLYLKVSPVHQGLAHGLDSDRTGPHHLTLTVIDDQIDVPQTHPRFGILKSFALVRQRP